MEFKPRKSSSKHRPNKSRGPPPPPKEAPLAPKSRNAMGYFSTGANTVPLRRGGSSSDQPPVPGEEPPTTLLPPKSNKSQIELDRLKKIADAAKVTIHE